MNVASVAAGRFRCEVSRHGECAGRHAVVGAVERHDRRAARIVPGQLDRRFDAVCPTRATKLDLAGFGDLPGQEREKLLDERMLGRRRSRVPVASDRTTEPHHGFIDFRVIVSERERARIRQAVDVFLPVGVAYAHALGMGKQPRERGCVGSRVRFDLLKILEFFHARRSGLRGGLMDTGARESLHPGQWVTVRPDWSMVSVSRLSRKMGHRPGDVTPSCHSPPLIEAGFQVRRQAARVEQK